MCSCRSVLGFFLVFLVFLYTIMTYYRKSTENPKARSVQPGCGNPAILKKIDSALRVTAPPVLDLTHAALCNSIMPGKCGV
jgi:hypothetical protein